MAHGIGAPIALSHSATGDLLALVITACPQSRHLGNDLSAGAGWQGSGGQLYARYRTASVPFGSAGERSWEVCRGIRRTHGRSLSAPSQRSNAFSVPSAVRGRAKVTCEDNLHGPGTCHRTWPTSARGICL